MAKVEILIKKKASQALFLVNSSKLNFLCSQENLNEFKKAVEILRDTVKGYKSSPKNFGLAGKSKLEIRLKLFEGKQKEVLEIFLVGGKIGDYTTNAEEFKVQINFQNDELIYLDICLSILEKLTGLKEDLITKNQKEFEYKYL